MKGIQSVIATVLPFALAYAAADDVGMMLARDSLMEPTIEEPMTGDDDGAGVDCPPQSLLDLIVQNGRVDCGPKCVYKHYDAEVKVQPLPAGISWQALWKGAGFTPALSFALINHGTCSGVYKTPQGQWNLKLDKRRTVRTGPIDKSHNGTGGALVTQCPWCDPTGPTDCSQCGNVPSTSFGEAHTWQINAENTAYLAELEPSSSRGVLCVDIGAIEEREQERKRVREQAKEHGVVLGRDGGGQQQQQQLRGGRGDGGGASHPMLLVGDQGENERDFLGGDRVLLGSRAMGADLCTGGKAWTYSFAGAQVYTTGGCSRDGAKCPAGQAFCCPDGSKPSNVTSCGDYCFDCNGSC